MRWGAHAPSRAVVGALADHMGAPEPVTLQGLNDAPVPTGEALVGTREGARAPQFQLHTYG